MCFFSAKREKVRQRGGKNLGETRSLKVVELVLIKNLIKIVKHVSAGPTCILERTSPFECEN